MLSRQSFYCAAALGTFLAVSPLGAVTIHIDTPVDNVDPMDGKCSLREAVQSANNDSLGFSDPTCELGNGPDEIVFDAGAGSLITIAKPDDPININSQLTIKGPMRLSGGKHSRIFENGTATTLTFEKLTFEDGFDSGGGGAVALFGSNSVIDIIGCHFEGNEAGELGGAVLTTNSTVKIKDSTFRANRSGTRGGALLVSGITTIEDSEFSSNISAQGGGAINCPSGELHVIRSSFNTNTASGELSPTNTSDGGGAIRSECVTEILWSLFEVNFAGGTQGGGALDLAANSDLTVRESVFRLNQAGFGFHKEEGGEKPNQCHGGAIHSVGAIEIDRSVFENNVCRGSGGAVYLRGSSNPVRRIINSVFRDNQARSDEELSASEQPDGTWELKPPLEPSLGGALVVAELAQVLVYTSSFYGNHGQSAIHAIKEDMAELQFESSLLAEYQVDEVCGGNMGSFFPGDAASLQPDVMPGSPGAPTCPGLPKANDLAKLVPGGDFIVPVPSGTLTFSYPIPGSGAAGKGSPSTCAGDPVDGIDLFLKARPDKCSPGAVEP
jgi:CSLREA domain-containing protein